MDILYFLYNIFWAKKNAINVTTGHRSYVSEIKGLAYFVQANRECGGMQEKEISVKQYCVNK